MSERLTPEALAAIKRVVLERQQRSQAPARPTLGMDETYWRREQSDRDTLAAAVPALVTDVECLQARVTTLERLFWLLRDWAVTRNDFGMQTTIDQYEVCDKIELMMHEHGIPDNEGWPVERPTRWPKRD